MFVILSLIGGLVVGYKFGCYYMKNRKKQPEPAPLLPLPDDAFERISKYIEAKVVGDWYADALVTRVFDEGFFLTCPQIYKLKELYKKQWPKTDWNQHLNEITRYKEATALDAKSTVIDLIIDTKKLLED